MKTDVFALLPGVAVFLVAILVALWASRTVEAWLRRRWPQERLHLALSLAGVLRVALLFLAGLAALPLLGVDARVFAPLFGAVSIGAGLALQHLAAGYASGVILLVERAVREGDLVRAGAAEGKVEEIRARSVVLKTGAGHMMVPNQVLVDSRVENQTLSDTRVLVTTSLEVPHAADLDVVKEALTEAITGLPGVLPQPAPAFRLDSFTEGTLLVAVDVWTDEPGRAGIVRSDMNIAILRNLRARGLPPGPTTDRQLRFR